MEGLTIVGSALAIAVKAVNTRGRSLSLLSLTLMILRERAESMIARWSKEAEEVIGDSNNRNLWLISFSHVMSSEWEDVTVAKV